MESNTGAGAAAHDAFVHQVVDDWRKCPLKPAIRLLLDHVEKLTLRPVEMKESDIHQLRSGGWSDRAIHDAVQIAGYFNYINRVADSLGIEPEAGLPHFGSR